MFSKELEEKINKLKELGKMRFVESATEDQIKQFENEKGIELPKQYKAWLMLCDGGELFLPAGVQLYGVTHNPIIDLTDTNRPDDSYVVIGALASGDPIIFKRGSEKICIYNFEAGRIEDDEMYDDFVAFLNDLQNLLGIGE